MAQYKTRIQLKSDIESNWKIANNSNFIPLRGELIIYSADENHFYSRLKIGDGITNVNSLPFIDSGTINGEEIELVKKNNFQSFPSPGSPDKLYVDLSTNKIYHYENSSGYTQLSNFDYSIEKTTIGSVISWSAGVMTTASIENNTFKVMNGILPELLWRQEEVVSDVTKVIHEEVGT